MGSTPHKELCFDGKERGVFCLLSVSETAVFWFIQWSAWLTAHCPRVGWLQDRRLD